MMRDVEIWLRDKELTADFHEGIPIYIKFQSKKNKLFKATNGKTGVTQKSHNLQKKCRIFFRQSQILLCTDFKKLSKSPLLLGFE